MKSAKKKTFKIRFDEIEKWARKNAVLTILSIVILVASSIVTLTDGASRLRDLFSAAFGGDSVDYAKIQSLATGATIDYFTSIMGPAAFRDQIETNCIEYIFAHPKYYVQAVTDAGGIVLMYSITTRVPRFNPVFNVGGMQIDRPEFSLVLGKTRFSQLPFRPIKLDGDQPADGPGYYDEKFYFGKPGGYRKFDFACAASGCPYCGDYVPYDLILRLPPNRLLSGIDISALPAQLIKFRSNCVVNTFSASVFLDSTNDIDPRVTVGPDPDEVSALQKN